MWRCIWLVFLAPVLAGCALFEPADCRKADLAVYADRMEQQIDIFRQQADLVAASPRMSMGEPLQRLLDLQTEAQRMEVPGCVQEFHDRTVRTMSIYQVAYQGFASQTLGAEIVSLTIDSADELMAETEKQLAGIRAGTPPVLPTMEPEPTTTP